MIQETSAMNIRQNLGEIINEAQYTHSSFLIKRGKKPVAAIVNIDLFDKIRLFEKEFNRLTSHLKNSFSDLEQKQIEKDIDKAVKYIRSKK